MTAYEIYIFVLCFIVFTLLTALFTYMIVELTKNKLKMIRHGLEDEEITKERQRPKAGCVGMILSKTVSLLVCVAFFVAFVFATYLHFTEDKAANGVPSLKVVKSESMASVHEDNNYIPFSAYDERIQMFDIVVTRHLPAEKDLQLYDVVVYEIDGKQIIHRIVDIEEPNASHPGERLFILQGDAVETPDLYPVRYGQMRGIYLGERIPFVGSFVLFLQSPAGWLCILLVLFAMIATPIVEKKLERAIKSRVRAMRLAQ